MSYQYAGGYEAVQNKNLMKMAIVIFAAVTSAIVLSAILIMSFIKGEVARAIDDASPVTSNQQSISAFSPANNTVSGGSCSDPAASAPQASTGASLPWVPSSSGLAAITNSFNNTNTSTSTVNNNVTENNPVTTTTITDSFNPVTITDNTVDSNNTDNSINDSFNDNVIDSFDKVLSNGFYRG